MKVFLKGALDEVIFMSLTFVGVFLVSYLTTALIVIITFWGLDYWDASLWGPFIRCMWVWLSCIVIAAIRLYKSI